MTFAFHCLCKVDTLRRKYQLNLSAKYSKVLLQFLKTLLIHDFSVKLCKANNAFMHCWKTCSLIAIHIETPSLSSFRALRKNGYICTHSKKQERKADILGTNSVLLKATSSRNKDKKSILSEELQTKS